jgi:hypothetical protein
MKLRRRYRVVLVGVEPDELEQYDNAPRKIIKRWWRLPDTARYGWPLLVITIWLLAGQAVGIRYEGTELLLVLGVILGGLAWSGWKLWQSLRIERNEQWKTPSSADSRSSS